ncbi:MAG: efflux transporter outer membrane subunit [Planctomycetota bacterium]|nr:efflux transporter outer membrane subunit [Planctomycetota bacterium]
MPGLTLFSGLTRRLSIAVPLAALAVVGCTVGPNYKRPWLPVPDQFSEIGAATQPTTRSATEPSTRPISADVQLQAFTQWWTTFDDPRLNSLIDRAIKGNFNLIAAEARLREARANRGVVASQYFPQVNAVGQYSHTRASQNVSGPSSFGVPLVNDVWQAGFDATWEIDVFGGTRRSVESADASIQAAVEDRRDVLISLFSEVALNYVELRGAQHSLAIARHNLASQQQTLSLTRSKAEGGLIPYLDVAQQEAQVATTAATIPTFETQIRQNIHRLGILIGRDPGTLSAELTPDAPIPVGPDAIPPGLPSELIRRRPDVRRAERQLAAATANIGVATADLFPKFSITGAMGDEAQQLKQLFNYSSRFYQIVPGVSWDIFDAGRVKSNIEVQNARQAQALAAYFQVILQSMQDVDDSLIAYNREQQRLASLRQAVDSNQRAVDMSTELWQKGSKDFLSVLDAQRSLFTAQDAMARSEQLVSTNLISLYKALGGGWQP